MLCFCSVDTAGHVWQASARDFACPPSPVPAPPGFADPAQLRQHSEQQDSDDRLLADLFRRALKTDVLTIKSHFRPTYHHTLEPGTISGLFGLDNAIELTDDEIDVLRRSV